MGTGQLLIHLCLLLIIIPNTLISSPFQCISFTLETLINLIFSKSLWKASSLGTLLLLGIFTSPLYQLPSLPQWVSGRQIQHFLFCIWHSTRHAQTQAAFPKRPHPTNKTTEVRRDEKMLLLERWLGKEGSKQLWNMSGARWKLEKDRF